MLAMHPEVQERAFQEIKAAHETQTSPTDAEIVAKLDYLEMCIKETMRLFPVGPFLARQNTDDIKISMSPVDISHEFSRNFLEFTKICSG